MLNILSTKSRGYSEYRNSRKIDPYYELKNYFNTCLKSTFAIVSTEMKRRFLKFSALRAIYINTESGPKYHKTDI